MRIPRNALLSGALMPLGVIAAGYQVFTYSGLYKLMSELQLSLFGLYINIISLAPLAIFVVPAAFTAPIESYENLDTEDDFSTWEEGALYRSRKTIGRLRFCLPVVIAGIAAPLLYAWTLSPAAPPPNLVDVPQIGDENPPLGPVTLLGTPDWLHAITLSRFGQTPADDTYAPVVGPNLDGKIRYLVHLGSTNFESKERLDEFLREGRITETLSQNTRSSEVRTTFEKQGAMLADTYYVLDTEISPPRRKYYGISAAMLIVLGVMIIYFVKALRTIRLCEANAD